MQLGLRNIHAGGLKRFYALGMKGQIAPSDQSPHIRPSVYVTQGVPGVGGRLREHLEDFIVEEVPLYQPTGEGEHVYLFLQKVDLSTSQLVQIVARHFGVPIGAIGYAGLKDKRAITRQVISIHVPGRALEDFPSLQHDRVQVLWADMHANKLRRGHLKANRFAIKLRGIEIKGVINAKRVMDTLVRVGVPNRAGEQRFGYFANNHLVGRAIVLGDAKAALDELLLPKAPELYPGGTPDVSEVEAREAYGRGDFNAAFRLMPPGAAAEFEALRALSRGATPERAVRAINATQRSFFISAFQSGVFNSVLDRRLIDDTLATILDGDLAYKHDSGAVFSVDALTAADPETQRRAGALEISPSGPNWGSRMTRASGRTLEVEIGALHAHGVREEDLLAYARRNPDSLDGDRRPLRVPLMYPDVEAGADEYGLFIRCSFELPPGAFATTVMQEIMKPALGTRGAEELPATTGDGA